MEPFTAGTQVFGLILARITGLFFTAPVLGAPALSNQVRLTLVFFISLVVYPVVSGYLPAPADSPGGFVLQIGSQALIGILMGFMMSIIFAAFQVAGEVFSVQVGLSFSEVLDPQSQVSAPILGTLKNIIGILLFVAVPFRMDGIPGTALMHMIHAIARSFEMAPDLIPDARTTGGILGYLDGAFGAMFVTALKIGIPVIGILFISSVALGLMGRAAPQMNLMNMGLQINIIVGTLVLVFLIPVIIPIMLEAFQLIFDRMGDMLRHWPQTPGVGS